MEVKFNGKALFLDEQLCVQELIKRVAPDLDGKVAVAINKEVIPKSSWQSHKITEGDVIEIVTIAQGG
jgi:sulfur carrier protein